MNFSYFFILRSWQLFLLVIPATLCFCLGCDRAPTDYSDSLLGQGNYPYQYNGNGNGVPLPSLGDISNGGNTTASDLATLNSLKSPSYLDTLNTLFEGDNASAMLDVLIGMITNLNGTNPDYDSVMDDFHAVLAWIASSIDPEVLEDMAQLFQDIADEFRGINKHSRKSDVKRAMKRSAHHTCKFLGKHGSRRSSNSGHHDNQGQE